MEDADEDYSLGPEDEIEKKPNIRRGFTLGRLINMIIMVDYVLVLVTALIVSGSLGVLNNKLHNYKDTSPQNRTCILYSTCVSSDPSSDKKCILQYNSSGGCEFIVAGFIIIGILALIYIVVCIIRTIFATDIWFSVIADIFANAGMVIGVAVLGITISIGLAVTCSEVNRHYTDHTSLTNCTGARIPDENGYAFYAEVIHTQNSAWFCFFFLAIALVVFIVRSCIFCRRKSRIRSMDNTDILTATDVFTPEDEESEPLTKPI